MGTAGLWLAGTGWMARGQLEQARADVALAKSQVIAGDLAAAKGSAAQLAAHAARAHHLTNGPVWGLAGRVPLIGDPLRSVHVIAAAADRLGDEVVPELLTVGEQLDPGQLRHADGTVDLKRFTAALPALEHATTAISGVRAAVEDLSADSWLPPLNAARTQLLDQLDSVATAVRSAGLAARLLPPMLGEKGAKTYFLAFQNDAEARGAGGLPGAFGILRAKEGKVSFDRFESDDALSGVNADVRLGRDFDLLYGPASKALYINGNLSPHFPYAAQIWSSMWKKKSGERVDGVIAVDPTVLSYLLEASGPTTLSDGTKLASSNVVDLTQRQAYASFADDIPGRKRFLVEVARASSDGVMAGHVDPTKLVKALGKAAGERRLLVWSADSTLQKEIAETGLSGVVPETKAPYAGLSIYNEAGNKLDYYLDRSLIWTRSGCRKSTEVTATIELTNNAPAGLSTYATNRSDVHSYKTKPGDNRLKVNYLATSGAQMNSVTINGKPTTAGSGMERGHPVFTVDVELPRGKTRTVVLHLSEPASPDAPIVLNQPLIRPLAVQVEDSSCR